MALSLLSSGAGGSSTGTTGTTGTTTTSATNGLTIPENTYPWSESSSNNSSNSSYSNNSNSNSSGQSFSGLPQEYGTSILQNTVPTMNNLVKNYPEYAQQAMDDSMNSYSSLMKSAYQSIMPSVLNELASKNVLGSSVASDAIGNAANTVMSAIEPQAYNSSSNYFNTMAQAPSMLGQLAQLGQYSESDNQSTSTSSGGGSSSSSGTSSSYTEDKTKPYEILYNLIGKMA